MIIKGPGVQARTFVIPHSLPELVVPQVQPEAASEASEMDTPVETGPPPEVQAAIDAAHAEASRIVAKARVDADRLRGQAQVELGRAQVEAERLLERAKARLEEVEEIIPTAVEARALLAKNTAAAAEIFANAEAERERIFSEAHTQGLETGLEEGRQAGREEGTRLAREELIHELELVHEIAAGAKVDREALIATAEPEIVRLAMEVTRKLIAREVSADPDILKGLLTRAMLRAAGDGPIRVRLSPQAIERLGSYLGDVTQRFASRGVEVVPDPTLEVAGVVVDTRTGTVDARLETQLGKVEHTLMSLAGGNP